MMFINNSAWIQVTSVAKCKSVALTCQQGPFATFKLQYDRTCEWTGIKFSNDGKLILLSTNGAALRILDAFKGVVLHSFGVRDDIRFSCVKKTSVQQFLGNPNFVHTFFNPTGLQQ